MVTDITGGNKLNMTHYGLKDPFKTQAESLMATSEFSRCIPGRVVLEHKRMYRVMTERGEWMSTVSGSYAFRAAGRMDFPSVGDWVLVEQMPGEEKGIIHALLGRTSVFTRKEAGQRVEEQIVAANVDIVFLVMSLNADFNARRLERYLVAAWDSGARPVMVLTKKDLCENPADYLDELGGVAFGVDTVPVSAVTGEGLDGVRSFLGEGVTAALLGSSGAGKSTLTNALSGKEAMAVQDIREDDAKGRHTTTHRELIPLPGGSCLIDTPGMRELQLMDQGDGLDSGFRDIDELAESCRYRDCGHGKEPGCTVREAVEDGRLSEDRLVSYFKLQREIAYIEQKSDARARMASTKQRKDLTKAARYNRKQKR